eukprot:421132-Prorocentrum_minimum.AAC.1
MEARTFSAPRRVFGSSSSSSSGPLPVFSSDLNIGGLLPRLRLPHALMFAYHRPRVREQGESLRGVEDEAAREAIVAFMRSVGARSGGFGKPRRTLLDFLEAMCRDQVGTPTVTTADTPPTHTDDHHPSVSPLRREHHHRLRVGPDRGPWNGGKPRPGLPIGAHAPTPFFFETRGPGGGLLLVG